MELPFDNRVYSQPVYRPRLQKSDLAEQKSDRIKNGWCDSELATPCLKHAVAVTHVLATMYDSSSWLDSLGKVKTNNAPINFE